MEQAIIDFVLGFGAKYPVVLSILAAVGVARLIFKPLFVFLHQVVDATSTVKDNEILAKVVASPIYKGVAFLLDYVGSIKLPASK